MGGSGSISWMIQSLKNNKLQKGQRKTLYDRKKDGVSASYGTFTDHTQMKSHEFASFQKELYARLRKEKRNYRIRIFITVVLTILVLALIPTIIKVLLDPAYLDIIWPNG